MKFFPSYIKDRRFLIILFILCCISFILVFYLYGLPVMAAVYPAGISFALVFVFTVFDAVKAYGKHRRLVMLRSLPESILEDLPADDTLFDADYYELIRLLREDRARLSGQYAGQAADMAEYYTVWVHQIKTPIASMRLALQGEDTEFSRRLSDDLFRIEQYVDMALCYIRLDSGSTDYVFREYSLDGIIKQALRRLAGIFIGKGIRLDYAPVETRVTTDEKWLMFVIEQVLSNALKYTPSGGQVKIYLESPACLCIQDTGIGIAPEDIPRVFSRGYTGENGRRDKRASGIGLYLCRRICTNLGHGISLTSQIDHGTCVRLDLETYNLKPE